MLRLRDPINRLGGGLGFFTGIEDAEAHGGDQRVRRWSGRQEFRNGYLNVHSANCIGSSICGE